MNTDIFKRAPHNPPHLFLPDRLYMLTASTYQQEPILLSPARKLDWIESFIKAADVYKWIVVAWVVLHNHYHAIVQSPENAATLSKFVSSFHKFTGRKWNNEDSSIGRKVWWNYWDKCLRNEHEFYARVRYIYWNPLKHGLSDSPEGYPFSNYKEFLLHWQFGFNFTDRDEVNDVPEF